MNYLKKLVLLGLSLNMASPDGFAAGDKPPQRPFHAFDSSASDDDGEIAALPGAGKSLSLGRRRLSAVAPTDTYAAGAGYYTPTATPASRATNSTPSSIRSSTSLGSRLKAAGSRLKAGAKSLLQPFGFFSPVAPPTVPLPDDSDNEHDTPPSVTNTPARGQATLPGTVQITPTRPVPAIGDGAKTTPPRGQYADLHPENRGVSSGHVMSFSTLSDPLPASASGAARGTVSSQPICSICIMPMTDEERVDGIISYAHPRATGGAHQYHTDCLTTWRKEARKTGQGDACPNCMKTFVRSPVMRADRDNKSTEPTTSASHALHSSPPNSDLARLLLDGKETLTMPNVITRLRQLRRAGHESKAEANEELKKIFIAMARYEEEKAKIFFTISAQHFDNNTIRKALFMAIEFNNTLVLNEGLLLYNYAKRCKKTTMKKHNVVLPGATNKDTLAILQHALEHSHEDTVKVIYNFLLNPDIRCIGESEKKAFFIEAIKQGRFDIVEMLFETTTKPEFFANFTDAEGTPVIMLAARVEDNEAVISQLLKHGANIKAKDARGKTVLTSPETLPEYRELLNRPREATPAWLQLKTRALLEKINGDLSPQDRLFERADASEFATLEERDYKIYVDPFIKALKVGKTKTAIRLFAAAPPRLNLLEERAPDGTLISAIAERYMNDHKDLEFATALMKYKHFHLTNRERAVVLTKRLGGYSPMHRSASVTGDAPVHPTPAAPVCSPIEEHASAGHAAKAHPRLHHRVHPMPLSYGATTAAANDFIHDDLVLLVMQNKIKEVQQLFKANKGREQEIANGTDATGTPVLFLAAGNRNREMIELLLRNGANADFRDSDGNTYLDILRRGHK